MFEALAYFFVRKVLPTVKLAEPLIHFPAKPGIVVEITFHELLDIAVGITAVLLRNLVEPGFKDGAEVDFHDFEDRGFGQFCQFGEDHLRTCHRLNEVVFKCARMQASILTGPPFGLKLVAAGNSPEKDYRMRRLFDPHGNFERVRWAVNAILAGSDQPVSKAELHELVFRWLGHSYRWKNDRHLTNKCS
jgi:hypothetical protein